MVRRGRLLVLAAVSLLILVAGCAQPGQDGEDAPDADGDDEPDGEQARVTWSEHPFLGSVLTDEDRNTLYIFTPDEPGQSNCTGGCADAWPPFEAEGEPVGPGDLGERLDAIEREDGTMQLTIDDRPLYLFAGDGEAGEASGQGRNGVWYVVRESEEPGQRNADVLDGPGEHEVEAEQGVAYGSEAEGYLAQPAGDGEHPGVVMIHEWWGLNDEVRTMADALASHGYAVLAVDLFNGSVAEDSEQAQAQVEGLNQTQATANMRQAADHLREEEDVPRVASLGWCFGGGQSLQLATSEEPLAASVIYYGTPLVTDADELSGIQAPVQGIFGDEDQAIPVEEVEAFEAELDDQGIENEIHLYEGVGHAFANPSGDAYAPRTSMDAWTKTLAFLEEHVQDA